jgi:hypothetical protein
LEGGELEKVVVEGYVIERKRWSEKGQVALVQTDGGNYWVGFSKDLRVPKLGVKVRIEGTKGRDWLFARRWEYITRPKGRTRDGFPVRGDSELERMAWEIIKSLNEFTVDDLHSLEEEIQARGRDRRVLGSILRKLANRGLIKEVRIVHSQREECHRRPVVLWTRTVTLDELAGR